MIKLLIIMKIQYTPFSTLDFRLFIKILNEYKKAPYYLGTFSPFSI